MLPQSSLEGSIGEAGREGLVYAELKASLEVLLPSGWIWAQTGWRVGGSSATGWMGMYKESFKSRPHQFLQY